MRIRFLVLGLGLGLGLALALACATPGLTVNARAKKKPLFGPALPWSQAQTPRSVTVAKNFCHGLKHQPKRLSRAERARLRVIEHPGLRWGLPVSKVRWVFGQAKWPVRLRCFAKRANAYLKLKRRVSKSVPGGPQTIWDVTVYFKSRAPYGVHDILMQTTSIPQVSQVNAVLKFAKARYGPAKSRPGYHNARYQNTIYTWIRAKTKIRLTVTYHLIQPRYDLSIRYSAK